MKRRPEAELEPLDEPMDAPMDASIDGWSTDGELVADGSAASSPDLSGLPLAGITRRRVAWVLAGVVSIWIVMIFVRQVTDANAATGRADQLRTTNGVLASHVDALQRELNLIQRQTFIEQQARAYGLGGPRERPFELAPGASPLPVDAPGSASVALGADSGHQAPLDVWLELLFGPSR